MTRFKDVLLQLLRMLRVKVGIDNDLYVMWPPALYFHIYPSEQPPQQQQGPAEGSSSGAGVGMGVPPPGVFTGPPQQQQPQVPPNPFFVLPNDTVSKSYFFLKVCAHIVFIRHLPMFSCGTFWT